MIKHCIIQTRFSCLKG